MTIVCWGEYEETIKHPAVDRQSSSNSVTVSLPFFKKWSLELPNDSRLKRKCVGRKPSPQKEKPPSCECADKIHLSGQHLTYNGTEKRLTSWLLKRRRCAVFNLAWMSSQIYFPASYTRISCRGNIEPFVQPSRNSFPCWLNTKPTIENRCRIRSDYFYI